MPLLKSLVLTVALVIALRAGLPAAHADQRKFVYSYEVTTAPKGAVEIENWVTWQRSRGVARADQFDFRHEFEFGVTDRLEVSLYVADWSYSSARDERRARYDNSGVEVIYNLTNPVTDFLGSAVYGEVLVGERGIELEGKLLLQKDIGRWTIAYNAIIEAAWEGERFGNFEERHGEFAQTLGVSYQLSPRFSAGAELLHEVDLPEWRRAERAILFAGPNASVRIGRFFATAAGLFQVTNREGEPEVQTRLIFGYSF